jgi:flagellin-like hook-associated protein FlgL
MISDQVVANLARSLERFMDTQVQVSTGRRINKPSDDPVGIQKDLRYRRALTEIAQFNRNIASGTSLLATYDNVLGNMKDILQSADELAVALSNDTYDAVARNAAANDVESLLEQMIELANTAREGRYIFSGHRTRIPALQKSVHGISYMGDTGINQIEIESGSKVDVNIIGSEVLFQPLSILGEDADWQVGIQASTLLSDLNLGRGVDLTSGTNPGQFIVTDNNLGVSVTVDLSVLAPDASVGDALTEINNQLVAGGLTSVSVDYGLDGNNLQWIAVDEGLISDATQLNNLNSGAGVDLSAGRLRFHTSDYLVDFDIDISGARTIGEVIDIINNDANIMAQGITVSIGADGQRLSFSDPLPGQDLIISEVSDSSTTAQDLGILGAIGSPLWDGEALNPMADYTVSEAATDQTVAGDLGLTGNFNNVKSGDALSPQLLLTDPLSLLSLGHGFNLGEIKISQGDTFAILDLGDAAYSTVGDIVDAINNCGLEVEASINEAGTGIQIVSLTNTETLIIDEVEDGTTAHELGIYGSPDMLGTMTILIDALRNNDGETAGKLIGNLNEAIDHLLYQRGTVGAKVIRMESARTRLAELEYNFSDLLSQVEDADITKMVAELAMQENSYQSALIASSKIIQPSLLDFLR